MISPHRPGGWLTQALFALPLAAFLSLTVSPFSLFQATEDNGDTAKRLVPTLPTIVRAEVGEYIQCFSGLPESARWEIYPADLGTFLEGSFLGETLGIGWLVGIDGDSVSLVSVSVEELTPSDHDILVGLRSELKDLNLYRNHLATTSETFRLAVDKLAHIRVRYADADISISSKLFQCEKAFESFAEKAGLLETARRNFLSAIDDYSSSSLSDPVLEAVERYNEMVEEVSSAHTRCVDTLKELESELKGQTAIVLSIGELQADIDRAREMKLGSLFGKKAYDRKVRALKLWYQFRRWLESRTVVGKSERDGAFAVETGSFMSRLLSYREELLFSLETIDGLMADAGNVPSLPEPDPLLSGSTPRETNLEGGATTGLEPVPLPIEDEGLEIEQIILPAQFILDNFAPPIPEINRHARLEKLNEYFDALEKYGEDNAKLLQAGVAFEYRGAVEHSLEAVDRILTYIDWRIEYIRLAHSGNLNHKMLLRFEEAKWKELIGGEPIVQRETLGSLLFMLEIADAAYMIPGEMLDFMFGSEAQEPIYEDDEVVGETLSEEDEED